jgi:hypothetical protein
MGGKITKKLANHQKKEPIIVKIWALSCFKAG